MSDAGRNLGTELERFALAAPDSPALSDPDRILTYRELLDRSRSLTASLGPARDDHPRTVALLMPHSVSTLVSVVAALLAGRAYCVLNPAQPRRRIEALLAAIRPEAIWASDPKLRDALRTVGLEAVEPGMAPKPSGASGDLPAPLPERPGRLCALYVTSGTTGSPKVVGYGHEATVRRAELYATAIDARPDDRFSLASPLWTAAAASHLFTALLSGASLHLLQPGALSPAALAKRVRGSAITVWHSTPSLFRRLAGAGMLAGNRFRVVRLGGEPLLASDVELARRTCADDALLLTGYSLTEANGTVTQRAVPLRGTTSDVPLDAGRPLNGLELRIERHDGSPASAGEEGEIVVGGEHLSAGYVGQRAAREPNGGTRFTRRGPALVLSTGDRGILRADGSLEVLGRVDGRLKIGGHRVDPSEVETAALGHDGVREAAAVPFTQAGGGTAMALFVAADHRRQRVRLRSLRSYLGERIAPEAMPAVLRVRGSLPLTDSGKVDRLRLARLAAGGNVRRPTRRRRDDPLLGHLQRLMRKALEVGELGFDEDFVELGGDSLAAVEVCAGIETVYGISMEPATLLRRRTARALARHLRDSIECSSQAPAKVLELNPGGGEAPLFVVPGAGSEATALVHFAEAIGAHQPVNVIQLPGVDGQSQPLTRMDAITAHCLAAIRRTGVRPPYRIAGTSFGGLVAYDVATELQRQDLETEYVGLFDTRAPSCRRNSHLTGPLRRFQLPPNLSVQGLVRSPRAELGRMWAPMVEMLGNYGLTFSMLLGLRWQPPIELRFRRLMTACSIAAGRWTPAPSAIPFHLYRCESQPPDLAGAALLGWDRHASAITLRPVPCSHGRHIRPPEVSRLAAMVNEDLLRSRARAAA
jgi:enterobactin synthetase component F